ncbi:MAG: type I DNA topoisomerase [Candidatus Omnitrophica bacterium]|nr:type I DNA topoisomerase [Candidatus Omnitrophota bacterium]
MVRQAHHKREDVSELMVLKVNGEEKRFDEGLTIEELLRRLSIPKEKVAVELNLDVIPKKDFSRRRLKGGDEVEIVHFVGGGSEKKALVVVESPAKCKTIHQYLGPGFEVAASMGHVIDLPKSKMGIDIDHNFEPQYIVVQDKRRTLKELKKKAEGKKEIYLACDPDREGEAISWHLRNALGKGKKVFRVVFNEITKEAIEHAFKHPGHINMDLVGAQQARRILDRLMGYSLSPLLWQKVGRGLSAGRVQSVALRMIVERERQIRSFTPEEYWSIDAELKKEAPHEPPLVFSAALEKIGGAKAEIKDRQTADAVLEKIKPHPFVVKDVRSQKKKRNPSAPFTTSKLQQSAYNELRFSASKTMRVAQTLYEGVAVGKAGTTGLITYMRTDSVRVSAEALREVREFIQKEYGKSFLPEKPPMYKAKKGAQEAHEAIRPTSVKRRPEDLKPYLTEDQFELYSLIWRQFTASQMMPAVVLQETADIAAGEHLFRSTGGRLEFPGYLLVRGKTGEMERPLPPLECGEVLEAVKLEANQHFTKPPPRFTDATLVKALEENGIGRPSTYAPTLGTLIDRSYVHREGGSLAPTELGTLVTDLLVRHFSKILDFHFTAGMESELDSIEEGKMEWVKAVRDFYEVFRHELDAAKTKMEVVKKKDEPTNEVCEKCGRPMVIKWGRRGRFMSCSGWPECKNAKSISTDIVCPQCGKGKLVERRARFGRRRPFYGCTAYPDCNYIAQKLPAAETAPPAG